MLEILAPAGNQACAKAAIHSGANAIYLGYSAFSARQSAENFDLEQLSSIIRDAHFCGVKVYVAMNTMVKNDEVERFLSTVLNVWNVGTDAIILQDVFLGKVIKQTYPDIVLHLSTQAGVCNENGAIFAKECGFSRVILARETPLTEIAKIAKILETEVFIQGALCTCFSGQCYFSSFVGGNSGNRGRCKQPCRKRYAYNRQGNNEKCYALSLSDLCVGEDIEKYIALGVISFKIEGRMRRAEYVAAAVQYYRAILDNLPAQTKQTALSCLKRTYNRGNYTKGLAFGQDKRFLSTQIQGHLGEKVGVVKVVNGKYCVESTFKPQAGDAFKILRDGKEIGGAIFIKNEGRTFIISSKTRLKNGDSVFITTDTACNEKLLSSEKKGEISLSLFFHEGECAKVQGGGVEFVSDECLQSATSRPLTIEELKSCFEKTDGLPVKVSFTTVDLSGNIFIPKSALNAFRRAFYEKLSRTVSLGDRTQYQDVCIAIHTRTGRNEKIAVIATDFSSVQADVAIYKPNAYDKPLPTNFIDGSFEKYVYYPAFCSEKDEENIAQMIKTCDIDGVYAENYSAIAFAKKYNCKVMAGSGLNLSNSLAISEFLSIPQATYYQISKELNEQEISPLISDRAFALSSGNIKLMDLCYCPFGKTCSSCDKKNCYELLDESDRKFPVRRWTNARGECRFEIYNCVDLVGVGVNGVGKLIDATLLNNANAAVLAANSENAQKTLYPNCTSGHYKRGVL